MKRERREADPSSNPSAVCTVGQVRKAQQEAAATAAANAEVKVVVEAVPTAEVQKEAQVRRLGL